MRHVISGGLVAALLGTALMAASAFPVSAQVARPQSALATGDTNSELLTLVQNRDRSGRSARVSRSGGERVAVSRAARRDVRVARSGGREVRRWNNNRRWSNVRRYRYGYRYGYWNRGYWPYYWGSGLAFGLGVSAPYYAYRRGYYVGDDAVAYCMSRFRSYDPVSGTYLGYDGLRHPCP